MAYSRRDLPLNALRAFEAVARMRSFTGAADSLNVAQSAISRHIARLEEILGRTLLDRSGKNVRLTDAGEHLMPIVQRSFDAMARAMNHLGHAGELRLHLPPAFVQTTSTPFVERFKTDLPDIPLTIMTSNMTGVPSADYDIAIAFAEIGSPPPSGRLLWPISLTPVCSMHLAQRIGKLGVAEALRTEDLLHVKIDGYENDHLWRLFARSISVETIKNSALAFETAALAIDFARAGLGMALADTRMDTRHLAAHGLAAPFELTVESGFGYYLVQSKTAHRREGAAELRRYIEEAAFAVSADRDLP